MAGSSGGYRRRFVESDLLLLLLPLLLFLLLLSSLQLLIAHTPELGELLLLILYCRAFGLQLLNL